MQAFSNKLERSRDPGENEDESEDEHWKQDEVSSLPTKNLHVNGVTVASHPFCCKWWCSTFKGSRGELRTQESPFESSCSRLSFSRRSIISYNTLCAFARINSKVAMKIAVLRLCLKLLLLRLGPPYRTFRCTCS
jgi:hypothetical protein